MLHDIPNPSLKGSRKFTGGEMKIIRKSNDMFHKGWWEVAHYWDDGVTIQIKYFKTKKEAVEYLKN